MHTELIPDFFLDLTDQKADFLGGCPAMVYHKTGMFFGHHCPADGISFQTGILADGVIEFFINTAFYINLFILLLSVLPIRYFHGQIKGMETDGLQILHIIRG